MKQKLPSRILRLLRSMKFGIFLLFLILLLSILGTVLPQGYEKSYYFTKYPPFIAKIIQAWKLNDLYSSGIFIVSFGILAINLILCSIFRFGRIINKLKKVPQISSMNLLETQEFEDQNLDEEEILKQTFQTYGMKGTYQYNTEETIYYATKNKIGYFGSWILHLGVLVVILFYALGHSTYFSESIYGVTETIQAINGTSYQAKLKDFKIDYREDGSIKQYTSFVELLDRDGKILKASKVSVNHPMRYKGYTFYQTSYGWAANCKIVKEGEELLNHTIYERTSVKLPDKDMAVYFNRFYPDFKAVNRNFVSLSDQPNNPAILYMLFYRGEVVQMNITKPGEIIQWNDYEITIDSPQRYSYLDVNKMRGQAGALFGTLLIMVGIILVFYFKPVRIGILLGKGKFHIYSDQIVLRK